MPLVERSATLSLGWLMKTMEFGFASAGRLSPRESVCLAGEVPDVRALYELLRGFQAAHATLVLTKEQPS